MRNAIAEKLRQHLASPVNTEPTAVYLLCETRKLLEHEDPSRTPTPLRMYCHWALHVDLTGRGTTEPFVKRVDDVVSNLLNGILTGDSLKAEHALVAEFASFDTFRNELRDFLLRNTLPTDLCDRDDRWFGFLEAYAGVIEDGSLLCSLNTVDGLTFKKRQRSVTPGNLSFAPTWVVSLKQPHHGHSVVEVHAEGSGTTYAWGYHLRP